MHDNRTKDDLAPEERREFERLPRESSPPRELEDRLVRDLAARGLIAREGAAGSPRWVRRLLPLAASLVLLASGFLAGLAAGRPGPATEAPSPRFLLLLHEPPGGIGPPPGAASDALVEEYRAWAVRLAREGRLLTGEKLKDGGSILRPGATPGGVAPETSPTDALFVAGYFLVRADSLDEALSIARTCPHLLHGGTIEVRQIDPV